MTLRKSAPQSLQQVLRQVRCLQFLSPTQLPTMPFHRSLVPTLALIVTSLLITLITAPRASAQDAPLTNKPADTHQQDPPPTKPAESQVSLPDQPRQSQRSRFGRPAPDAPKEAVPAVVPAAVAISPGPTPAASPLRADDHLPFMASEEPDSHGQPPSALGLLVRTLGALLLIVGLIVAASWGMKRYGGARFGTPLENAPALVVLNSLSLGERRSLTIVRFGDRTLLLGSTAHAVTLLAESEVDDFSPPPRSVADILDDANPAAFSHELFNATAHLDEQLDTRRRSHSTT